MTPLDLYVAALLASGLARGETAAATAARVGATVCALLGHDWMQASDGAPGDVCCRCAVRRGR